jgi:RHS repeat-associated protein
MGPDFEWNQTASVGRIHIRLGDQVIATHEEAYAGPSGGGCAGSGPAMPGHGPDLWGPLVLFFPGALALLLAWLGSLIAFKERGQRARAAMALATVGAFVWATVVPLGHLGEAAYASSPASVTYYHPDHLGSSIVTSSTFTSPPPPPQYVLYRPYGGVVAPTAGGSTAAPQFGFTGQRFEASVGIYDYGARWYDPALGRFLQADSMVPDPTDTQSLNRYSYVRNDPLGRIDPGGSWDLSGAFASVGGFISDYVGQPLAQFGSGLYDGFAYEYFGGPPPQPGSSWFYNQGLGVSSLLSQPVNVAAYGAGTALEAMGRVLPLAGVPYALAAPFTGVGMTLQDDSVQWALYADQYNRLDLGQRTGASWLADDIASLGFGGFGNAGGLLDGAAGVLTGAFAGDPGLIKGSAIGFIDSIVPRYGLRAGPGWPAPIDDSARPPFWNAGDIPALPHDMDYSVPGPRFGADRAIAGAVWDWSLPQPGPVGQVYRALLSGLFIGKAYTWDQLTDPPAESR